MPTQAHHAKSHRLETVDSRARLRSEVAENIARLRSAEQGLGSYLEGYDRTDDEVRSALAGLIGIVSMAEALISATPSRGVQCAGRA